MSFIARVKFFAPNPPPNKPHKVDPDLAKQGQRDKAVFVKKGHEDTKGWFAALHLDYMAEAGVNVAAGTAAGGINKTELKLVKHIGELSPFIMRALNSRAVFNMRVEFIDRTGQFDNEGSGKVVYTIEFKTAVIQRVRQLTGDQQYGSLASSISPGSQVGQASDTQELEEITIVYQGADYEWLDGGSKKGTIELRAG